MILEHTGTASYKPGVHWDLLCEVGESLRAWEFREDPLTVPRQQVSALPDHRSEYLEYEGPISGERGYVRRVHAGCYEVLLESATEWVVRLRSDTLVGELRLQRASSVDRTWTALMALQSIQSE